MNYPWCKTILFKANGLKKKTNCVIQKNNFMCFHFPRLSTSFTTESNLSPGKLRYLGINATHMPQNPFTSAVVLCGVVHFIRSKFSYCPCQYSNITAMDHVIGNIWLKVSVCPLRRLYPECIVYEKSAKIIDIDRKKLKNKILVRNTQFIFQ